MRKADRILEILAELEKNSAKGVSAVEISLAAGIDRTNVSRYLNRLYEEKRVEKVEGRPVLYRTAKQTGMVYAKEGYSSVDKIASVYPSLQQPIQQAKAAILYPPRGLHTLILGETGVGKSMFAELMYRFALESGMIPESAPFVCFNCADYADNPQLVISQIFGVKRGAYTGADKDREGLLQKADGGMLLLDEVHRLSPQGQEMLFTFIDKGYYTPLGETEKVLHASVQIIAATTEEPQSYLLNTFVRRIPMIIKLPSLQERGLAERHYLIESFIKQESKRIGKSIYVSKDSLIPFLLYDCTNNIGQLKSDIQLACARAFVNFKSKNEEYIFVTQADLPQHVKKGVMKISERRHDVEYLLKNKGDTLRFSFKEETDHRQEPQYNVNEDFYDIIEKKLTALKHSGIKKEINHIINMDIESHFKKYIFELPEKLERADITNIISKDVLELVDEILNMAKNRLGRKYDDKIYFGLALHINGFIERMRKSVKIYHPKLNLIRVEYPDEFLTAMEAAKLIDKSLGTHTPLDEIGYLAMFLASDPLEQEGSEKTRVGVLVIMHGRATASSMVEVCNALVGVEHSVALDMPLTMKPQAMYEAAKEAVIRLDKGRGVIMLVDMGSLVNFGNMISEETGIIIKTIEAVSTSNVIDACSKAVLGRDIYYIYESCKGYGTESKRHKPKVESSKRNIIIAACFTGEGASEKLKEIIDQGLGKRESIEIVTLEIMNRSEFLAKVERYREDNKILAVVSTVDIELSGIPFIPAVSILAGDGLEQLEGIVKDEETYNAISQSLKKHVLSVDMDSTLESIRNIIDDIELSLNLLIKNEVKIGIALHLCFLADKLKSGGKQAAFNELEHFRDQYTREMLLVGHCLKPLEKRLAVRIGESEIAHICKMFLSNNELKNEASV